MAAPVVAASAQQDVSGSGATSVTVTLGAGPSAGDLLLLFVRVPGSQTITYPSGFTQIASDTSNSFSTFTLASAYKVATGSEGTGFTASWSSTVFGGSAVLLRVTGAHASSPLDVTGSGQEQNFTDNPVVLGLTTLTADSLHVIYAGQANLQNWTMPSGYTEISGIDTHDLGVGHKAYASTGATGNQTITIDNGAANVSYTRSFAIKPTASSSSGFKDATARLRLAVRAFKDAATRLRLVAIAYRDATTRLRLNAGTFKDAGVRFLLQLGEQIARPTADVSNDNWTTDTGATTSLYTAIDEVSANDADYIQSSPSPADWEEYQTRVGDIVDPGLTTGHAIRVRFQKSATGGDRIDIRIRLYRADGVTVITETGYADIDALQTFEFALSEANADAIPYADYPDLVLGIAARENNGAGGSAGPWL